MMKSLICIVLIWGIGKTLAGPPYKDIALFSQPQTVSHRDFVVLGNGQFHNKLVAYGRPYFFDSEITSVDDFVYLASAYKNKQSSYKNIFTFDRMQLFSGESDKRFWSYINSPTYKGGIAYRAQDDHDGMDWQDYYERFKNTSSTTLFNLDPNLLSAASKYDFLLGQKNYIFRSEINKSINIFNAFGEISKWSGICHGTAPASYNLVQPQNNVTVKAYDGRDITFSVDDLKRLGAHLYARNRLSVFQVGKRCQLNELNSRNPRCLDTNPATFHLALLNYVGVGGETFIVDNAYDSIVWNRPVMGFEFRYRNLKNGLINRDLKYSLVKRSDFQDSRAEFRSPSTYYLVGIQMKVKLLYGDEARANDDINAAFDVYYDYDLEVDPSGNIIGGEWHTAYHPDFIWAPKETMQPNTSEDFLIRDPLWNGKEPLSEFIRKYGEQASSRGRVMNYIIRSLYKLSHEKEKR